jgi:hypothetical protein
MRGCLVWPTKKQRPESWLGFVARHSEILAIANPSAKAFRDARSGWSGVSDLLRAKRSAVDVLLAGGAKATQTKDIANAKQMARELKRAKP